MTTTLNGHIEVDESRVARIAGSRVKVINLVMEKMANEWNPEQIQQNFPHLSIAAIYAALTYYHDHRAECDAQIDASARSAAKARAATSEGPFVTRMRSEGKLP
jgi:uncharacterized protein (DUF433 family)